MGTIDQFNFNHWGCTIASNDCPCNSPVDSVKACLIQCGARGALTRLCPPVISWFINPINYRYITYNSL